MNNNLLPENEYTVVDDRMYINPNVALQEQTDFIANLRDVQQKNNTQINADTRNLGTDIASSMGGLLGSDSYFTSRYQTPQTNVLVADLRATAQAQALSDALKNEQAKYKQRYNRAYRNARRRNLTPSNPPTNPSDKKDDIVLEGGGYTAGWDRILQQKAWKEYLAGIEAAKQQLRDDTNESITITPKPSYQNKNWQLPTPTYQGGF